MTNISATASIDTASYLVAWLSSWPNIRRDRYYFEQWCWLCPSHSFLFSWFLTSASDRQSQRDAWRSVVMNTDKSLYVNGGCDKWQLSLEDIPTISTDIQYYQWEETTVISFVPNTPFASKIFNTTTVIDCSWKEMQAYWLVGCSFHCSYRRQN